MDQIRDPISSPAERRIHRQARSATRRELALAWRKAGWTFCDIAAALGVCRERARQIVSKAERMARRAHDQHWWDPLPIRARQFLHGYGLTKLSEMEAVRAVAQLSRRELMRTPNFGSASCAALVAWLVRHGLTLQRETPTAFSRRLIAEASHKTGKPDTVGSGAGLDSSCASQETHTEVTHEVRNDAYTKRRR
jgi:hypothetical protein